RHLGATPTQALVAGALVTLPATRALMSNYVLAENLLTFLVVCTAWAAFALAARPHWRAALALGLTVGAMIVVHQRALPLAAVTALWTVWVLRRHWRTLPVALGPMTLLVAGGWVLQESLTRRLFIDSGRLD